MSRPFGILSEKLPADPFAGAGGLGMVRTQTNACFVGTQHALLFPEKKVVAWNAITYLRFTMPSPPSPATCS